MCPNLDKIVDSCCLAIIVFEKKITAKIAIEIVVVQIKKSHSLIRH